MDGEKATSDRQDELIQSKHDKYSLNIEQLEEEKQAKIILEEQDRDEKIQTIQNNRDGQIVELEKERDNRIQHLQRHYHDNISRVLDKQDCEAKLAESTIKDGVRNTMYDLNNQIKTCQLERDEAIKDAKIKFEQEMKDINPESPDTKTQMKCLGDSLDMQIRLLNDSCHKQVTGLMQMQTIKDLRHETGNVVTEIQKNYNVEMDKLKKEHDESVCLTSNDYQRKIEHLQQETENQICMVIEDSEEKISHLKDLYGHKIEDQKTKMDQDINNIVEGSMCF